MSYPCQSVDSELFYPATRGARYATPWAAIDVCNTCPIKARCYSDAVARGEQFGIWVGVDMETDTPLKTKGTHCRNGHPFTAESTYINPTTLSPRCRICQLRNEQTRKLSGRTRSKVGAL